MNTYAVDRRGSKQQLIIGKHKYQRQIVLSYPKHKIHYGSGAG